MLCDLQRTRFDAASVGTSGRRPTPCVRPLDTSRRGVRRVLAPVIRAFAPRTVSSTTAASPTNSAVLEPPTRELEPSYVLERLHEQQEEALLPLPMALENVADDAMLANPLKRMERLSTGWFGVVMEYEGVLVPDTHDDHVKAWYNVADERGYSRPRGTEMKRIKNVRDDVIVTRVFNWTRNPAVAKKVAERKVELYDALRAAGPVTAVLPSSQNFLETMCRYSIPVALTSALPAARLASNLEALGMTQYFSQVVSGEDSGAAEVEFFYTYAAQMIKRPHPRCVVVGGSNSTVEAAHELGMKVIIVAGTQPSYHFGNADLVVRSLDQVSFINMKQLFANEELVASRLQPDGDDVSSQQQRGSGSSRSGNDDDFGSSSSVFGWGDDDEYNEEEEDVAQGPPMGGAARSWR